MLCAGKGCSCLQVVACQLCLPHVKDAHPPAKGTASWKASGGACSSAGSSWAGSCSCASCCPCTSLWAAAVHSTHDCLQTTHSGSIQGLADWRQSPSCSHALPAGELRAGKGCTNCTPSNTLLLLQLAWAAGGGLGLLCCSICACLLGRRACRCGSCTTCCCSCSCLVLLHESCCSCSHSIGICNGDPPVELPARLLLIIGTCSRLAGCCSWAC